VLKVQQLLHICSEHFDSKEKEEDKDKKEKKDKDKKEAPADMGAHQVMGAGTLREALRKDKHVGKREVGLALF
jgi:26S proteasome regulatory subunit N1